MRHYDTVAAPLPRSEKAQRERANDIEFLIKDNKHWENVGAFSEAINNPNKAIMELIVNNNPNQSLFQRNLLIVQHTAGEIPERSVADISGIITSYLPEKANFVLASKNVAHLPAYINAARTSLKCLTVEILDFTVPEEVMSGIMADILNVTAACNYLENLTFITSQVPRNFVCNNTLINHSVTMLNMKRCCDSRVFFEILRAFKGVKYYAFADDMPPHFALDIFNFLQSRRHFAVALDAGALFQANNLPAACFPNLELLLVTKFSTTALMTFIINNPSIKEMNFTDAPSDFVHETALNARYLTTVANSLVSGIYGYTEKVELNNGIMVCFLAEPRANRFRAFDKERNNEWILKAGVNRILACEDEYRSQQAQRQLPRQQRQLQSQNQLPNAPQQDMVPQPSVTRPLGPQQSRRLQQVVAPQRSVSSQLVAPRSPQAAPSMPRLVPYPIRQRYASRTVPQLHQEQNASSGSGGSRSSQTPPPRHSRENSELYRMMSSWRANEGETSGRAQQPTEEAHTNGMDVESPESPNESNQDEDVDVEGDNEGMRV